MLLLCFISIHICILDATHHSLYNRIHKICTKTIHIQQFSFMYIDWTPLRTLVATILPSSYSHSTFSLTCRWNSTMDFGCNHHSLCNRIHKICTKTIHNIQQFSFMYVDWTPLRTLVATIIAITLHILPYIHSIWILVATTIPYVMNT